MSINDKSDRQKPRLTKRIWPRLKEGDQAVLFHICGTLVLSILISSFKEKFVSYLSVSVTLLFIWFGKTASGNTSWARIRDRAKHWKHPKWKTSLNTTSMPPKSKTMWALWTTTDGPFWWWSGWMQLRLSWWVSSSSKRERSLPQKASDRLCLSLAWNKNLLKAAKIQTAVNPV